MSGSRGILIAVLSLLSLTSCTRKNAASNDGGRKIVRWVFREDVKYADPAMANDLFSIELMAHIFEGLLEYNYLGRMDAVGPLLATKMPEVSNKGLVVTFEIRKGIKFQDDAAFPEGKGREVTTQDFVYAIKRIADPRLTSPNWWMFDGAVQGLNEWRTAIEKATGADRDKAFEQPVKGLQAPSPYKLVFRLVKPYPQLLHILAMPTTSAIAKEVVDKYGPEIINHPVGTGPFRLKNWIRGAKIAVERNPTYRQEFYPTVGSEADRRAGLLHAAAKPIPFVDEIQWDIIKEEQPRWLKFLNAELDSTEIPKDNFLDAIDERGELKKELADKGIQLHKYLSLTSWWIEFNLKDPIVGKNLKLRQALAYAFDKGRALELLYNNRGILANSPIPPAIEGGEAPAQREAFNLELAKALLSEAGYPEGKGLPELTFDLRGPGTTHRQLGELLRDNFAKIGVKVNILANSFPEALEKARNARFQIMLGGWIADYPDPENFLQLFYGPNQAPGTNSSNFQNKEFDALYVQIRNQQPGPERLAAVQKMVKILQRELPGIWFYHQMEYKFSWKRLKNYRPHLFHSGLGKYVDIEL